jgi:hypothetical protein
VGGLKIGIFEHRRLSFFSRFQQRPNSLDKVQPGWISVRDLPAGMRLVAAGYFNTMEDLMKPGDKPSASAAELAEMINKAIFDLEICNSDYDKIMKIVHADQHLDAQEKNLLKQLQDMLANGTIKRVAG